MSRKILVARFSSIGDIVLTTPVIRCLKKQLGDVEIHFATKKSYASLLVENPYLSKVHALGNDWDNFINPLKSEGFEILIDLHNNIRTRRLSSALGIKTHRFNKLNKEKWILVNLKRDKLPDVHIVDRYIDTCRKLEIKNDHEGLDYFIPENVDFDTSKTSGSYIAVAIGGQHKTKKMPTQQLAALMRMIQFPMAIIGGPEDREIGELLEKEVDFATNYCGKTSVNESARIIEESKLLITHDTGMMHIGAALKKDVLSIWGNTVPKFGMTPYQAGSNSQIFEVNNLNCRPCSKIGFDKCPKGHFKCMVDQNVSAIANAALVLLRE